VRAPNRNAIALGFLAVAELGVSREEFLQFLQDVADSPGEFGFVTELRSMSAR